MIGLAAKLMRDAGIGPHHLSPEDVVQSAWASTLAQDDVEDFTAYAYRCIRNCVRQEARRKSAEPVEDPAACSPPSTSTTYSDEVVVRVDVERALRRLPPLRRRLLVDADMDGRTHREIAAEHGKSPGWVTYHVMEGRALLTAALMCLVAVAILMAPAGDPRSRPAAPIVERELVEPPVGVAPNVCRDPVAVQVGSTIAFAQVTPRAAKTCTTSRTVWVACYSAGEWEQAIPPATRSQLLKVGAWDVVLRTAAGMVAAVIFPAEPGCAPVWSVHPPVAPVPVLPLSPTSASGFQPMPVTTVPAPPPSPKGSASSSDAGIPTPLPCRGLRSMRHRRCGCRVSPARLAAGQGEAMPRLGKFPCVESDSRAP